MKKRPKRDRAEKIAEMAVGRTVGDTFDTWHRRQQAARDIRRAISRAVAAERKRLIAACKPFVDALKDKADFKHESWNPDAHVEITVTIAEARALDAILSAIRNPGATK